VHPCIATLDRRVGSREALAREPLDPRATPNRVDDLVSDTATTEDCADKLAPFRSGLSADAVGSFDRLSAATHASNAAAAAAHDYFAMHEWRDDNDARGPTLVAAMQAADVELRQAVSGAHHTLEPAAIAATEAIAGDHEHSAGRDATWWALTAAAHVANLRLDIIAAHASHARDLGRDIAQRDVKALYELAMSGPPELYKTLRSDQALDALYAAAPTFDPFSLVDTLDGWRWGDPSEPFGRPPEAPEPSPG
jgi:hypothetical protein